MPLSVIVENFRSFRGRHIVRVAPITVLVGENSSGKTALMAAMYASIQRDFPRPQILAEEPFLLPTPETQMARGTSAMTLGTINDSPVGKVQYTCTFGDKRNFWSPTSVSLSVLGKRSLTARKTRQGRMEVTGMISRDGEETEYRGAGLTRGLYGELVETMARNLRRDFAEGRLGTTPFVPPLSAVMRYLRQPRQVFASSPLRMKPKRIYEARNLASSAEGEHIPQMLNVLVRARKVGSKETRQALSKFGSNSGLFSMLSARRMNTPAGQMFSLLLGGTNDAETIQDVGYGVSQALPIVGEILMNSDCKYFLIQQPEVHLHPRSQVALASFFVDQSKSAGSVFVIETHSDYIVDRIRADVKRGKIPATDVVIYFVMKGGDGTQLSQIGVDEEGNLIDAPDDFRSFFLNDQMDLLGIS